jgi:hypothetical protein
LGFECSIKFQKTKDEIGLQRCVFECVATEVKVEAYIIEVVQNAQGYKQRCKRVKGTS